MFEMMTAVGSGIGDNSVELTTPISSQSQWVAPDSVRGKIYVTLFAPGGGGSGGARRRDGQYSGMNGAIGGSGESLKFELKVMPGDSLTYYIGAGGGGGAGNNNQGRPGQAGGAGEPTWIVNVNYRAFGGNGGTFSGDNGVPGISTGNGLGGKGGPGGTGVDRYDSSQPTAGGKGQNGRILLEW